MVDVHALALAALLMLVGSLSDIVGRRRAIGVLGGLLVFTLLREPATDEAEAGGPSPAPRGDRGPAMHAR